MTDDTAIKNDREDPNMVKYRPNIDTYFVRRNMKNEKNSHENDEIDDSLMCLTVKCSEMLDKKPAGVVIFIKGSNGAIPKPCDKHPSDNGCIYKCYQPVGANYYMADELNYMREDFKGKNATTVIIDNHDSDTVIPISYTCDNLCQFKILPQRTNSYKYFTLCISFFKFEAGQMVMLDKLERKISIVNNPSQDAFRSSDYHTPWSNSFAMAKKETPPNNKHVELNMSLKLKIPRDAEVVMGIYFDTLLNNTKKIMQAQVNDLIHKDLLKAKKHVALINDEKKSNANLIRIIRSDYNKDVNLWRQKCIKLEDDVRRLKNGENLED